MFCMGNEVRSRKFVIIKRWDESNGRGVCDVTFLWLDKYLKLFKVLFVSAFRVLLDFFVFTECTSLFIYTPNYFRPL